MPLLVEYEALCPTLEGAEDWTTAGEESKIVEEICDPRRIRVVDRNLVGNSARNMVGRCSMARDCMNAHVAIFLLPNTFRWLDLGKIDVPPESRLWKRKETLGRIGVRPESRRRKRKEKLRNVDGQPGSRLRKRREKLVKMRGYFLEGLWTRAKLRVHWEGHWECGIISHKKYYYVMPAQNCYLRLPWVT